MEDETITLLSQNKPRHEAQPLWTLCSTNKINRIVVALTLFLSERKDRERPQTARHPILRGAGCIWVFGESRATEHRGARAQPASGQSSLFYDAGRRRP